MKKIERIKDKIIVTLVVAITIILAVLLLMSCERKSTYQKNEIEIVVIDSCEYIKEATAYLHAIYVHKGNCRFCAERNKRMVHQQVDSILLDIFE